MKFHQPASLDEAVRVLGSGDDVRCIAGGVTLVAMMNADLVRPAALVSLRELPELHGMTWAGDGVRIGAMTAHHTVAAEKRLTDGWAVVRAAARQIGHPAIRHMGTMGGSICHADPAADYPTALTAANAVIEIHGAKGTRRVPAEQFFLDFYTTALEPGELVTAIHLPPLPAGAHAVYRKVARTDGDFATASLALVLVWDGTRCTYARVAVGGCAPTPVHVAEADARLAGSTLDDAVLGEAGALLARACDPVSDFRGSAQYRRLLVPRLLREAVVAIRSASGTDT